MEFLAKAKPFLAVSLMQFSYAVMSIIAKSAMNQGMSPHVLVAYRMAVASILIAPFAIVLERKTRPKMTFTIFAKIMLISLFEPVLDQNLFYTAMKYTTTTFTTAICNTLPAVTFLLACIFRLENMDIKRVNCQAKVVGTVVAIGGATMMTLMKGKVIGLPWRADWRGNHHNQSVESGTDLKQNLLIGALLTLAGCFSWSFFIILQTVLLQSYPAQLSLTAMICVTGMVEAAVVAFAVEKGNTALWSLHSNCKLLAVIYGGVVSGTAFYIMGWVLKRRGPVFVSAFNPLNMVIVAILGSFFLAEKMYVGRIIGSVIIVIGIYIVLWGKSKDRLQSEPDRVFAPIDQPIAASATVTMMVARDSGN
ncbi:hypothetical protein SLE2022_109120 [Rubroshorea leprosula]